MTIPHLHFPQTPNTFPVCLTDGLCFYFTAKVDENSPSSRIYEPDPSVLISPLWSQWDGVLPARAASAPGHQAQSFWKTQRSERSRCGGCPTPSPQPAGGQHRQFSDLPAASWFSAQAAVWPRVWGPVGRVERPSVSKGWE